MTNLEKRLEQLSPEKRALVLRKLGSSPIGRAESSGVPPLVAISRDRPIPLSFAQQRLWFIDQLEGPNSTYNMRAAVRLAGALNRAALEYSLHRIWARHEALRTFFPNQTGQVIQMIAAAENLPLAVMDLQDWPPVERAIELQRVLREEPQRPFDLARGPLARVLLLQLGPEEHVLLSVMHHIVSDGWSLGIFIQELTAHYTAYLTGQPDGLPELSIQYADFAAWQRKWLEGEVLERQLEYWKRQLRGAPETLRLPLARPRPAAQTYPGRIECFQVPLALTRQLQAVSQETGATMFMTLLAAFACLLGHYSGQEDIVIGSPIAGRNRKEIEPLIGFFVNSLVLRADLKGNPSFRELLRRIRQMALDAYSQQDLPFEKLVEVMRPERSLGHTPLFQVAFSLQNLAVGELKLPGLCLTPIELHRDKALFDLTMGLEETGQGLNGVLEYNTDLFDAGLIRRMLANFQVFLAGAAAAPDQRISDLPFLADSESKQLLEEWNDVRSDFPKRACVPELFEEQAQKRPEAVAVVFGDETLSYGELNQRANQLAHYLKKKGIGPESIVAVMEERSADLMVTLLGILKAGGAYFPIDLQSPKPRISAMIRDSGAALLLTREECCSDPCFVSVKDGLVSSDISPETAGNTERAPILEVVWLDRSHPIIAREPKHNPPKVNQADHLAYVIYTSGSTGQPKGVAVTHEAIARLLFNTNYVDLNASDRVAQASSVSFDAATFEIWGALLHGGCLIVLDRETTLTPRQLAASLRDHRVTVLFLTTALFNQMARETPSAFQYLRHLLFGGEAVDPTWVRKVLDQGPPRRLLHVYGPTESTTFSTWHLVKEVPEDAATVPIGGPVSNTDIYVLDRFLQPVPTEAVGELFIGGAGLGRCYLHRPDISAEKFIPHPFSPEPGARLYRTGDLVRYRPDGQIEFCGRSDHQVKIRGFRIELGEIEATLAECPEVRESVVMIREDSPGEKRLVAYVVLNGRSAKAPLLRAFLKEKLPEYMLPAAFVLLERMPLTINGKFDRDALPAPVSAEVSDDFVAPATPTEEVLCGIWAELLGLERLGVHDNFFERGGHSLLATQCLSRLRDVFALELPVRDMFLFPTISKLSGHIDVKRREEGVPIPPIGRNSRGAFVPLSFAQERLWFLNQLEGESTTYNIPAGLRLSGCLEFDALERCFNEILRRHEILRTSFSADQGEPRQVIQPDRRIALTVVDLRGLPKKEQSVEVRRWIADEAGRPFDLLTGPLLRGAILRLAEQEHVLFSTVHHIAADGWSVGVFVRELTLLYNSFSRGELSPLPELPIQYADFAIWQRGWLQGQTLERLLGYWKNQLTGAPPVLELPADRPRPAVQTFHGSVACFDLSPALARELKALSQRSGTSLFMTLLSGFATLLSRYSSQEDIIIGSPIANRNRSEIEPLIGFFVNTLVLRLDLSGNPRFQELLRRVRQVTLEAYDHQDLPFERLVEHLQPVRNLKHTPLFQVMFILQNVPLTNLALCGLTAQSLEIEHVTAKTDLTLALTETAEGLQGAFEFNTDLFERGTIQRMIGHYQNLLEAIASDPSQRIGELAMLEESERRQLLVEWNRTERDYPRERCLTDLFEEQVEKCPAAVAVMFGEQALSYGELNQRANQLAHYLQSLGVGPEVLVGICAERSLEMVTGLLGILKAGGAYLPLDPAYPKERLTFMLADAKVNILLTQEKFLPMLAEQNANFVCLDQWKVFSQECSENPPLRTLSSHLAYVLYTSGSTGQPKGVAIEHHSPVALIDWAQSVFGPEELAGVLAATSICFDLSIFEIFLPLASGGGIILAQNALELPRLGVAGDVTLVNTVPSAIEELLRAGGVPDSVRTVNLAGEPLSARLVDKIYELPHVQKVYDLYGPSEDTTYSTVALRKKGGPQTIGRPIANTQIYILDQHLQPVPAGVPGEIYIGGAGLARGYLYRPELTAERFVPNPFDPQSGARLYKTGDAARYQAGGNIEFLGRLDHQVKIRGFRIELGEIEAVLARHPDIHESVVLAREDAPGEKRLVAYLVSEQKPGPTPSDIFTFLKQKLPDHMVPSALVVLDSLPRTPNGKIDRRALPKPGLSAVTASYVAPRSEVEFRLQRIWEEVLNLSAVGILDNFFELGGHSLLALRLMARIEKEFGRKLPLATLFQGATIEDLGAILLQQTERPAWSPLVSIQAGGSRKPLFCIHPVGGNVLVYADLARYLGADQPVYGLQARGFEENQQPFVEIEEMAAFYLEAMRRVQPQGPYYLAGYSFGGWVAFEIAQQLRRRGEKVAFLALLDMASPSAIPEAMRQIDSAELLISLFSGLPLSLEYLRQLSEEEQVAFAFDQARQAHLLPPGFGRPEALRYFNLCRTNQQMSFRPQRYDGCLTLFRASEESARVSTDAALGWAELATDAPDIRWVPGKHETMLAEPHVRQLADQFKQCLERARPVSEVALA
jgi:amino acid adenylation domain-containing protein